MLGVAAGGVELVEALWELPTPTSGTWEAPGGQKAGPGPWGTLRGGGLAVAVGLALARVAAPLPGELAGRWVATSTQSL